MTKKKANLLTENVVFIIIAILFIGMLFTFITKTSSNSSLLEQAEAKKVALILDSARPGTNVYLNIDSLLENKQEGIEDSNVIRVDNDLNMVTVKLRQKSGYSYGFFNDVEVTKDIVKQDGGTYLILTVR